MISKGIIVITTQGFGNRLRMLASAKIYADSLNLPLYVCWKACEECNIELIDIIRENTFKMITFDDVQKTKYCYFGRVHTNQVLDKIDQVINDTQNEYDYILLEGGHEFTNMSRLLFLSHKQKFYNSLVFVDNIKNKLDEFNNHNNIRYGDKKYIGIHYRDVISKYDEGDIKNNDIVNFTKNSPLDKFIEIIESVKDDNTEFILVSNSNDIYNKLVEQLQGKTFINSPSKSYDRNTSNDMLESVVDFLILSSCDVIIGSYFSSFSDEASFFNFIPKITPLSNELTEDITATVQKYHCLNYSFIDGIAALNYNDKIFIETLNLI